MEKRSELRKRKKIVIKVGSSTITHEKTGQINIEKIEKMARRIADLKGMGKDVILVSSGAIAAGRQALGNGEKPKTLSQKQAFSAVGQARLMMIYQKIFSEYNITTAQVLMTKSTMIEDDARYNAQNTFDELLALGRFRLSMKMIQFLLMRCNLVTMTDFPPLWLHWSMQIY